MRLTQGTIDRLLTEIDRQTGIRPAIPALSGVRQPVAYLLGVLRGADPLGTVHQVEAMPDWIRDIDAEYKFDAIPETQLAAFHVGIEYGKTLRGQAAARSGASDTI
jgi:hypothetical protein